MRQRDKRLGIAMLLWALAACEDTATTAPEDEEPTFEDDEETPADHDAEEEQAEASTDSGRSVRPRDAGGADAITSRGDDAGTVTEPSDSGVLDAGAPSASGVVPEGAHCAPAAAWDAAWSSFEEEVLRLTNEARAAGHNCDSEGSFGATEPLVMEPRLRCSARLFSRQMAMTNTFSHTGSDGSSLTQRLDAVGYTRRRTWGENIAKNQQTPEEVVKGWLDSDGHCRNIMNPGFTQIGIGLFTIPRGAGGGGRDTKLWTQNFATPSAR